MVAARSVDRLGRSLTDLLGILQHLKDKRVDLFMHQQGLDTSTTAGKAMFQMLGVFAEFERGIIKERVNAGLARAREKGVTLGRPRIDPDVEKRIIALRKKGYGYLKIGRELGVGNSAVQRVLCRGLTSPHIPRHASGPPSFILKSLRNTPRSGNHQHQGLLVNGKGS
jgi:DNA invertase Pin-like site-specific DNA recombinase